MKDAVILLSGGMDSGVLLAWAKTRYNVIHALTFDYGSKHSKKEIAMATALAGRYGAIFKQIELPFINTLFSSSLLTSGPEVPEGSYKEKDMLSTVVSFRNGIMLSIAIGYAENLHIDEVLIASHKGDHPVYPDTKEAFIHAMSKTAKEGTYTGVKVLAPFGSLDKKDIADKGRALNFDFTMTWTCYKGLELHCGKCAACLERKYALGYDKGLDPTRYMK
ncbi:MAG: 7-cyano-7-deazaguanine synthase QueC [Deltaproteobacteria bacterium]|nr:7-cyano-7-deazaguanine synthase QueC [Deltaproteobacteria bacterium]